MRLEIAIAAFLGASPAYARRHSIPPATTTPLWIEGPSKGALPANAPIHIQSFVQLARALGPAVVNVIALQNAPDGSQDHPSPPPPDGAESRPPPRARGIGTGFIIQQSGYVLTNAHVVAASDDIRVRLVDERELSAQLIGVDERTDLALLKIEAGGNLPVAPLGNSDEAQIGEWVFAIGNPFGLDHTVTAGIISAKGRRDVRPGGSGSGYYDFLQTDASINPGNSGGPLFNTRGEVIGINTAMNAQAQGIGFAIPINMAKVIVPLLKAHGRAPRSWLGLYPQPVTAALKKAFGLPDTNGALVADVVADSPVGRAGLVSGDLIRAFDAHTIKRADDLMWLIATAPPGRTVKLSVLRDGKALNIDVKVELAPDDHPTPPPAKPPQPKRSPLGMVVAEISPAIARELGKEGLHGVVVMLVEAESPAVEAGVERGDLILRIGDTAIGSLDDYARLVRAVPRGGLFRILLSRGGRKAWVAFQKR